MRGGTTRREADGVHLLSMVRTLKDADVYGRSSDGCVEAFKGKSQRRGTEVSKMQGKTEKDEEEDVLMPGSARIGMGDGPGGNRHDIGAPVLLT